jgi:hypothetical protein
MKMSAGETKAAPAIRALKRPRHMLRFASGHHFAHGRVARVRTIVAVGRARGRHGAEDRRHPVHSVAEPHVEIPFVIHLKRLHPAGNRMVRQLFEIRHPMRIHRPVDLKRPADPVEKLLLALCNRRLHAIVQTRQPSSFLQQRSDGFQAVLLQQCMAAAAVAIHDHGGRARKRFNLRGPAVRVNDRSHVGNILKTFLKQQTTRAMLVFAGTMTRFAGEKDDFFISAKGWKRRDQQHGNKQFFHVRCWCCLPVELNSDEHRKANSNALNERSSLKLNPATSGAP